MVRAIIESDNVEFIDPHFHVYAIFADPDDNKFVDCAFAADATYIVSDDKHFDILANISFPQILVLKLKEFLNRLNKTHS